MQENIDPNNPTKQYTGVWIPKHVIECEQLSPLEKICYGEIRSFEKCYASNAWFAKRLHIHENSAGRMIQHLIKLGFVEELGFNGRFRTIRALADDPTLNRNVEAESTELLRRKPRLNRNVEAESTELLNIDKSIDNSNIKNKVNNIYVAPVEQAPLPQEALDLADLLKEKILKNQPTARIDKNYQKNWAKEIEKAHRIDGRTWEQLRGAITYAQDYSDFWGVNIRSGAKLRKHYDRLEADLRRDFNRRGTMILPNPQNAYNEPLDDLTPPF
nr:MAG TPA: helix-turn-helix domain protein [Caudoviricetes sp.]